MDRKAKIGASIVLDGEKEFKSAVTSCNKNLSTMKSELNLVKEKYAENANSLEALKEKHVALTNILSVQKSKVEASRIGLEHAQESQKKVADSLSQLKNEYLQAQAKMELMKNTSSSTEKELSDQEKVINDLAKAVEKGERNYETVGNRVDDWKKKLNTAETQVIKANRTLKVNDAYMEEAEKSTDKCAKSMDRFGKKTRQVISIEDNFKDSLKANVLGTQISNGLKAAGSAIKSVGESAVESAKSVALYADDMNTLATQTGVSTDTLQELKYMENLVDVSLETVTGSMAKNIKSMSNVQSGSEKYVSAYKKLGVSVMNANGELRDSEEVYWDVIDALGNVKNETERNATAMTIFGKSAQTLNPLIAQGSKGINELKKEAQDVGAVLSTDTLNSMNAVNDQFDRMSAQSEALKRELGVELAPSVLSAATEIGTAIKENKDELIGLASAGMDVVTTGLTWIIDHAQGVAAGVTAITISFGALKAATAASNFVGGIESIASMATPIGATIAVVGLLASGIAALKIATSKMTSEEALQKKAFEETVSAMDQKNDSIKNSVKTANESITSSEAEVSATDKQVDRLLKLKDVENKSTAQKNEMKTLVDDLSDKVPGLSKAYDEQTGYLSMENDEIKNQIKNWKQLYLTQALQDDLKETYKAQYEAQKNVSDADDQITKSKERVALAYNKAQEAQNKLNAEYAKNKNNPEYNENNSEVYQEAIQQEKNYLNLKTEEEKNQKTLNSKKKEYNQTLDECTENIKKCEKYSKDLAATNEKSTKSTKDSDEASKKTAKQYDNITNALSKNKTLLASYSKTVSSSTQKAFEQAVSNAKKTGTNIPKGLSSGLKSGKKTAEDAVKYINNSVKKKLSTLIDSAEKIGVNVPKQISDGVKNGTVDVVDTYELINKKISKKSEAQKEKLKKAGIPITKEMKEAYKNGGSEAVKTIKNNDDMLYKLMEESGTHSVDGLVKGLQARKQSVIDAYTKLGLDADKAFKASLDIHSPSKVMKKNGQYTIDGLIAGLKSKEAHVKKVAQKYGELLNTKMQNKIDNKELKNFGNGYNQETITKYWGSVVKATKKGTSAHTEALKSYYKARTDLLTQKKDYISNLQSSYKDKLKNLNESIKEAREEYEQSVNDTQSSIAGTWGLFSKADVTKTNNADGLISNMKSQADMIAEWKANMDKLRKSGLSSDLIKELESAGVSSAGDVATMASMSQEQLAQYQSYYNQKNAVAKKESVTENATIKASTEKNIATYTKQLNAYKTATQKKLKEFEKNYKKQMNALKKQMKKLGKDTADGFAKGLSEGNNSVVKSIAQMTGQTVAQVKKNLGIRSPSRVMARLGEYTGVGFANGLQKSTENLSSIITGNLPNAIPASSSAGVIAQTVNQPVAVTIQMDGRTVGTAAFDTVNQMQGATITMTRRGLATNAKNNI